MKELFLKLGRLFIGLFLYAIGIVFTINASIGLAPWDVFHQGFSKLSGLTMGQASIITGLIIIIIDWAFGERVGLGTIFNMLFIGIFMDILMLNHLIPTFSELLPRVLMMLAGMFVIGIASYFYIGAGLGSGPRDGLMVALTKKTRKSVRFIRNSIELTAVVIGFFMGGKIGVGTLAMVIGGGYFVQFAFKLFKFDVKTVKHQFLDDYFRMLKETLRKKGEKSA